MPTHFLQEKVSVSLGGNLVCQGGEADFHRDIVANGCISEAADMANYISVTSRGRQLND